MRKEYSINELAEILGCSRTAVVKKIIKDGVNPLQERYKNRYEVVVSNGIKVILLDDEDLEREKKLSKGVKNVTSNSDNTVQIDDFIEIEPEKEKNAMQEIINFTERYITEFKTFQETSYNELRNVMKERDNFKDQVLLLEDSEKRKQDELFRVQAENVTLKKHKTCLTVALSVITLVLVSFITFYVTWVTVHNTLTTPPENVAEEIEAQKKPVAEVVQPKLEQQPQPVVTNKKGTVK